MTIFGSPSNATHAPAHATRSWTGPAHAMPESKDDTPAVSPFYGVAVPDGDAPHYPVPYRWRSYLRVRPDQTYRADLTWSEQGWPLVADDFWRISHEDRAGARRADARVVGLGLAAALLSELVLAGQVYLTPGSMLLTEDVKAALNSPAAIGPRERFGAASILPDRIADELLTVILGEHEPLPVEVWLEYLASRAAEKVARRLHDAGHVEMVASRRRLRREVVYRPVDDIAAAWPAARLLIPLRQSAAPSEIDVVLNGLCRSTGLYRWLFAGQPAGPVARLLALPDGLPAPFPLLWDRLDALVSASASSLR